MTEETQEGAETEANDRAVIGGNMPPLDELTFPEDQEAAKALLKDLRERFNDAPDDVSKGTLRDEIKAVAYKVTRLKTRFDGERKEKTAEWRRLTTETNAVGKILEDGLSELAATIRKPVTEWEEAQEKRRAEIDAKIKSLEVFDPADKTSSEILERVEYLETMVFTEEEYDDQFDLAEVIRKEIVKGLTIAAARAKEAEDRAAELEELRREKAEREKREADERAQKEADEKAAREEQAAKDRAAQEALEAAQREAQEARAEADRLRREAQEAEQAEARRSKEEAERVEREEQERLAAEKRAAEEKAAAEKAEADRKERERLAAERIEEAKDETLVAMSETVKVKKQRAMLLEAIISGAIPNVKFEVQI